MIQSLVIDLSCNWRDWLWQTADEPNGGPQNEKAVEFMAGNIWKI